MSDIVAAPPPPRRTPRSRAFTREVWAERLARYSQSGLTPAQFCALEAVSLPSFYAWRRRLAAASAAPADSADSAVAGEPRLLPVRLQPPAPVVELVLATGTVLRLPTGCDVAWVRALVVALGEPSC
jgi:hypothetical protein